MKGKHFIATNNKALPKVDCRYQHDYDISLRNKGIFVYNICLINISASLSVRASKISILNIEEHGAINFHYKFELDVLNASSVTQV